MSNSEFLNPWFTPQAHEKDNDDAGTPIYDQLKKEMDEKAK